MCSYQEQTLEELSPSYGNFGPTSGTITKIAKGKWNTVFGNENPIHIEVGMGKGQFITEMAKRNPQINYIGIERYTSVLLRAVEKLNIYIELFMI